MRPFARERAPDRTDDAGFERPALDFRPEPPPISRENSARLKAWVALRAASAARATAKEQDS